MPNIWAHIQFGKEVIDSNQVAGLMEDIQWRNAFQLGCQGPDFLFYDHFWPWQSTTPLNRLGSQMHNIRCGPFLYSLFEEARTRSLQDAATAYTIGFLLHHILDRHLHPFVFSRSGFRKWHHQRFETAMDSIVLHKRAGVHTGTTPVAPQIDTGGRLPDGFSADFLLVIAKHYPVLASQITSQQLDDAVAQMVQAQRIFFDPTGWKGKLTLGQLQPFSPPKQLPKWDVLNEARQIWVDPSDRTVEHSKSAMELWDQALLDGNAITAAGVAWLTSGTDEEAEKSKIQFRDLLQDISYETGRPCGSARITYANSVIPV